LCANQAMGGVDGIVKDPSLDSTFLMQCSMWRRCSPGAPAHRQPA